MSKRQHIRVSELCAEFEAAVSDFMLARLQVGSRALEQALAQGAASKKEIIIREGFRSMRLLGIVPTNMEVVETLLLQECERAGLNAYTEARDGRLLWDCDPKQSPWGAGRPWCPVDLTEEIAVANAMAAA